VLADFEQQFIPALAGASSVVAHFKKRKMKRNLELVKLILEHFENKEDWSHEENIINEGYDSKLISYHIDLLFEAGLINGEASTSPTGRIYDVLPFRLTWEGHEFLENVKDNFRWKKIKQIIAQKGGNFSFELIKKLAFKLAEQQLLGN
jgi:hypothetical protein